MHNKPQLTFRFEIFPSHFRVWIRWALACPVFIYALKRYPNPPIISPTIIGTIGLDGTSHRKITLLTLVSKKKKSRDLKIISFHFHNSWIGTEEGCNVWLWCRCVCERELIQYRNVDWLFCWILPSCELMHFWFFFCYFWLYFYVYFFLLTHVYSLPVQRMMQGSG